MRMIAGLMSMAVGVTLATAALAQPNPATTPPTVPTVPDPMQDMVCRKSPETGSLVKTRKRCHTRAQWQYLDEENQRASNRFVDDNRGRPSYAN